jgi:methyl-accepting chemotaxis protein
MEKSRIWQARDIDLSVLAVVGINVIWTAVLGVQFAQPGLAAWGAAASVAVALSGFLLARGTLKSALALTLSLVMQVALQIHLSGGMLLYHFNVFVSMSFLLVYRDWRPIATMAALFAVHHIGFDRLLQAGIGTYCLAAPDPWQIGLHVGFVAVQCLILCWVAVRQHAESREASELEFLVNAMGRNGRIRLNLDVIRAETAAGQRLQQVQHRMAETVREIHDVGQRIEQAAELVAVGSSELMVRTDATARELKDSAMCLDQIGVIVQHSTEASSEAKSMSSTAAGMADQGDRLVANVVSTMQEIEEASRRITDIIAVIDGIAFQTNILALNAAIEAARAGEQGRGFAVVAHEVRSLAQRSAEAAKQIKSLTASSAGTVESGSRMVSSAGETMNQLVGSVKRVGELFETVTEDTSEQMEGLRTVSQSIAELGTSTQRNVEVAERAGTAAAELRDLAARLAVAMAGFNMGGGTSAVPPTRGDPSAGASPDALPSSAASAAPAAPVLASERLAPSVPAPAPAPVGSTVEFF